MRSLLLSDRFALCLLAFTKYTTEQIKEVFLAMSFAEESLLQAASPHIVWSIYKPATKEALEGPDRLAKLASEQSAPQVIAESASESSRYEGSSMNGLGKKVCNNVAGKVQSLIAGPVAARSAAARVENVSEDGGRRGRRDGSHRRARAKVVVEDAVCSGRQRRRSPPDVLPALP